MNGMRPQNEDSRIPNHGGPFLGVCEEDIPKGESGDVGLYSALEPHEGTDVTAYGTVTAWACFGDHLINNRVVVWKIGSQYRILGGECP